MSKQEAPVKRKPYKILTIVVRTYECKTEKLVSEVTKTIDDDERRKWIAEHVLWATMNGNYVDIINKDDDKENK